MKVFVAGATGRVAEYTLKTLSENGHQVTAGARSPERVATFENVSPTKLDLHATVEELAEVIKGRDAIIFTAGSRGKDLLQTDAFGAVKLMQAAEQVGIKRFILLSCLFSLEPNRWDIIETLKDYYIAKYFADNYLVNQTILDYTIVQPGILEETEATGTVSLGEQGLTKISIPDVGAILGTIVDKPVTFKQIIPIHPGSIAIEKAFEN